MGKRIPLRKVSLFKDMEILLLMSLKKTIIRSMPADDGVAKAGRSLLDWLMMGIFMGGLV